MKQEVGSLYIQTFGQGLVLLDAKLADWVVNAGIKTGLLTLWCRHTSASLIVQENADPTVQEDILRYLNNLVPEDSNRYAHHFEGADDMPAHLKSMLTQTQLSIPVIEGQIALGIWQGIYLFEHRRSAHQREIVLHLLGEEV